jgi:hypothetical protein
MTAATADIHKKFLPGDHLGVVAVALLWYREVTTIEGDCLEK